MDRAYRRAKDLVQQNISVLHECADLLMEREQIDGEDLQASTLSAQLLSYIVLEREVLCICRSC